MITAELRDALASAVGCRTLQATCTVGGGSIHNAIRADTDRGPMFVKYGAAAIADQLMAECDGVEALARANAVRTPTVLACSSTATHAFAVFEWLELDSASSSSDEVLGRQLAQLHRVTATRFGWHRDNFIGATEQRNAWCEDWIDFWRRERLDFQLQLAARNRAGRELIDPGHELAERLAQFFVSYTPVPSLIHGDLWSGNRASDERGQAVIFDPAVYFADREAELAMCALFGGFSERFERAYTETWPLDSGARMRCGLYQLYHVLNHFNLFGGAYASQAERLMCRLLAEVR